jgi:hypothetical protein
MQRMFELGTGFMLLIQSKKSNSHVFSRSTKDISLGMETQ